MASRVTAVIFNRTKDSKFEPGLLIVSSDNLIIDRNGIIVSADGLWNYREVRTTLSVDLTAMFSSLDSVIESMDLA